MANSITALRVALIVATALSLAACGGEKTADAEAKAGEGGSSQTVTVATAVLESLPRTVSASGTISAWEEVPVGAETGGLTATGVYVDEGSYVRQGQPLVQMNDALLRAQLRQQQASLDTALANQRASAANMSAAEAALSEIRTRLSQATIKAPVSGLVISRNVTRGQIISPGSELFRIVRDGRLELDAQVPETELGLVRAGQGAVVSSDQVGETTGRVRIVTPEVDPQTRLGIARITLTGGGFRPGMFGRARIDVGTQPAVTLPTAAVLYRENRAGVFILDGEGRARFRPVAIVSRSSERTAVTGIEAGARIIVSGAGFLGEGDRVRVAPAAVAATPAVKAS